MVHIMEKGQYGTTLTYEPNIPEQRPKCDVPNCKKTARWRCSAGFYYCKKHKHRHGTDNKHPHGHSKI